MRVVLVGPRLNRVRLRDALADGSIEVVGEASTVAEAREIGADTLIIANGGREPSDPRADDETGARDDDAADSDEAGGPDGIVDDDPVYREPLTPREIEVLELLAEGLANKAIASRLGISDQTVKFHVSSIYSKLGAANRTDAVRRAVRRGLIAL
jgi:DNA-binding CsgD family transcriptional regulator